jgi:GNAT superfamily N-acetyltransferase
MLSADIAERVLCDAADLHAGKLRWIANVRHRPDNTDLYLARLADGAAASGPVHLSDEIPAWAAGRPLSELLAPEHVRSLEGICANHGLTLQGEWGPIYACEPGMVLEDTDTAEAVPITGSMILLLTGPMREQLDRARDGGEDAILYGVVEKRWLVGLARGSPRRSGVIEVTVFVDERHRGRGLGRAVARAWLREALKRGHVVVWCTTWDNVPSQRIALACGYLPCAEVLW